MRRSFADGAAPLDPRLLMGGLVLSLVGGTALGAVHLAYVQSLGRYSPLTHVQAHAHAQTFGFFGAFIVTFGLHLLPRFCQRALPFPRLARATPWLLLAGAWLHFLGQPATRWGAGYVALALSAPLLVAGAVAFALNVLLMLRGFDARDSFDRFVRAGVLFFAAGALFDAFLAVRAALVREPLYPLPWAQAMWHLAVFGGLVVFTLGVAARAAMPMLGGGFISVRPFRLGHGLLVGFIPLEALAWLLPPGGSAQALLLALGHAGSGLGILLCVWAFVRPKTKPLGMAMDKLFTAATVSALTFLALGGASRLAVGVGELAGRHFDVFVHDAIRHLFTVGFLLTLTVGMASKLLPSLRGTKLRWRPLGWAALGLVVVAVLARSLEALASFGLFGALKVSAWSGGVAWVGLVLFVVMMAGTLRRRAPAKAREP